MGHKHGPNYERMFSVSEQLNETAKEDEVVLDPTMPIAAIEIRKDVKIRVDDLIGAGEIRSRVVADLAEVEIDRRTKNLAAALSKRNDLAKELGKIKPDRVDYDENGQPVGVGRYSREQSGKVKETKKKLTKIDAAINKAINNANFDALQKCVSNQ